LSGCQAARLEESQPANIQEILDTNTNMKRYFYTTSVVIVDRWGTDLTDSQQLEDQHWEEFKRYMIGLLDLLAKTSPGATLLEALGKTSKNVYIFSAPRNPVKKAPEGMVDQTGLDTAAKKYPGTLECGLAAMVKDMRPAQKNFDLGLKGAPDEVRKFKQFGNDSPYTKKRNAPSTGPRRSSPPRQCSSRFWKTPRAIRRSARVSRTSSFRIR
jgi:hypothetical protein